MTEQELKSRLWAIILKEDILVTNQNIDWLIGRVFKEANNEQR
jgi:hypothetical protein